MLIRWFILTVAVWAAVEIVPGFHYENWPTIVIAALVLGILNMLVKPVLTIISIPFILLTFGLFLLVINAAILKLTAALVSGFSVDSWGSALMGSLVISLVSIVAGKPNIQVEIRRL